MRAARNQQLFRELNDAISKLPYSSAFNEYVCECGLKTCLEVVRLSVAQYREIREDPTHFIVLPGHWSKKHERVVAEGKGYLIVERSDGIVVPPRGQGRPWVDSEDAEERATPPVERTATRTRERPAPARSAR
jgi:hypothetical protein